MPTKAGFVALIGKPNAGKSTLLNALVGAELSIVTSKPQTTRRQVSGILTHENVQIIFLDTPGILKPRNKLDKAMLITAEQTLSECDLILVMLDLSIKRNDAPPLTSDFMQLLEFINLPKILILNKIDLIRDKKQALPIIDQFNKLGIFKEIIPISALNKIGTDSLLKIIGDFMPESEFYYDPEDLSALPERFFVAEIIRRIIYEEYREEIPYSTEVYIADFKERQAGKWYINAEIFVERESQKIIFIGSKGSKLKSIGELARKEIEEHLQMEVFLDIFVKVRDRWRDNPGILKSLGYSVK